MGTSEVLVTPSISHLTSEDFEEIYEPAEDSFLLLDALELEMPVIRSLHPSVCLEIGCGSGIISSCVSSVLGSSCFVIATDINPRACSATRQTAAMNNCQVESIQMNRDSMLLLNQCVDILLFNPPYVVTSSEEVVQPFQSSSSLLHHAWAGGVRGREVTDLVLQHASDLLAPKSIFYLVAIKENDLDDISSVMMSQGFDTDLVISRKIRGEHLHVLKFHRGFHSI